MNLRWRVVRLDQRDSRRVTGLVYMSDNCIRTSKVYTYMSIDLEGVE